MLFFFFKHIQQIHQSSIKQFVVLSISQNIPPHFYFQAMIHLMSEGGRVVTPLLLCRKDMQTSGMGEKEGKRRKRREGSSHDRDVREKE